MIEVKIFLQININQKNKIPVLKVNNNNIKIKKNIVIEQKLNYPTENIASFEVENVFAGSASIDITKIEMNGIETNVFYNTSFEMKNNQYVKNEKLTSINAISFNGLFRLELDDLYINSHRSQGWHVSKNKKDFIFHYEFTNNNFSNVYKDRNYIGFDSYFIPCFGCSFTYGPFHKEKESWPFLLAQETGKKFLNLGVCGAGIDLIYNNLTLLYSKYKFKECVILFPPFERRVIKNTINNLYFNFPNNLETKDNYFYFFHDINIKKQIIKVKEKILKDNNNIYSKKILYKIIKFCNNKNIKLFCSSWSNDVYDHLQNNNNIVLLPTYPNLNIFTERSNDNAHPHKKHHVFFVNEIKKIIQKFI
jgi:hypothetical protein